jgi:hypothetical protein
MPVTDVEEIKHGIAHLSMPVAVLAARPLHVTRLGMNAKTTRAQTLSGMTSTTTLKAGGAESMVAVRLLHRSWRSACEEDFSNLPDNNFGAGNDAE